MEIFSSDKMFSKKIGNFKYEGLKYIVIGDFKISYSEEENIYTICRIDGKSFDGNEKDGTFEFIDGKLAPATTQRTFEEKLIILVDSYSAKQSNGRPFLEFFYKRSEDNKIIKIYPIYLDREPNVFVNIDTKLDTDLKSLALMVRTEKICRGIIDNDEELSNLQSGPVLTKKLTPPKNRWRGNFMAKMTLYTRLNRYKGLKVLLDETLAKEHKRISDRNKINHPINTEKSRLSPVVREILEENPIKYLRR